MAKTKLSMKEGDVQVAIANYFYENFSNLTILGKVKPDAINRDHLIATIQDGEYQAEGKYRVVFDFYGKIIDGTNGIKENQPFSTSCIVIVKSNAEGSPDIEINDNITLTKK
jgi:hypothetical protein